MSRNFEIAKRIVLSFADFKTETTFPVENYIVEMHARVVRKKGTEIHKMVNEACYTSHFNRVFNGMTIYQRIVSHFYDRKYITFHYV